VEHVTAGEVRLTFADAVRGTSLWDGEALRRLIGTPRQGVRPNGSMGWEAQDGRLVAFMMEQPVGAESATADPAWGIARVAADVTDDRGAAVSREHPELPDAQSIRGVLIHDSAATYYVLADTGSAVAGRSLRSFVDRLAHAWALQNPSLLRRRIGEPPLRVVLRRNVRERVRALYPFFEQETRVTPLVWRDSVYWVVHLYAASDWYPLSSEFQFGDVEVRYLHHAAVALVNARSGRTTAVPMPKAGPMAASWIARFPELFADAATLDADLLARVPPAVDGAWLVAQALSQAGMRGEYDARGHLPVQVTDSVFARAGMAPFFDRTSGKLALAIPILEPTDEVRGILVAAGGYSPAIRWQRQEPAGPKWSRIVTDLHAVADSLRTVLRGSRPVSGPVRLIPTASSTVAVQTHYLVRPDGTMQVLLAALRQGDSVSVGRTLMEAAGIPEPVAVEEPLTPEDFRRRVEALYESMREAMRRADWAGIGSAYEALGRLLRSARQP